MNPAREHLTIRKHGGFFQQEKIMLLNNIIATVDTKVENPPCLNCAVCVTSIRNCILPHRLDEFLVSRTCGIFQLVPSTDLTHEVFNVSQEFPYPFLLRLYEPSTQPFQSPDFYRWVRGY